MIDAKFHKSELKTSDFINSFMGPLFFETVGINQDNGKKTQFGCRRGLSQITWS